MKILSIVLVLAIILPGVVNAVPVSEKIEVERLSGKDRTSTAVAASKEAYPNGAGAVVLAGFNGEVDALTGTLLASDKKAPLLLTHKDKLTSVTKDEIKRLKAKTVYILGGKAVVSQAIENQLKKDYIVVRVQGKNRFETASKIAEEVKTESSHVFLALGIDNLADALAIGPVSAGEKTPVLLTKKDGLPKETIKAMKDLNVKSVSIIGGEAAVSKKVKKELEKTYTVKRVWGETREKTAIEIAETYFPEAENLIVAYGRTYPDALVGGYLGEIKKAPILLTNDRGLTKDTEEYISSHRLNTYILGGEKIISKKTANRIEELLNNKAGNSDSDRPSEYSITDIKADLNTSKLAVEISAEKDCKVDVRILSDVSGKSTDWTSGRELGKGQVKISEKLEKEYVDLTLSSTLPENFVVVVSLLDHKGNQLAEKFVSIDYTKAYKEYESKTVDDFESDEVLNLDEASDNNFIVLREEVHQLKLGENGKNKLIESSEDQNHYEFENADANISQLNKNDKIVLLSEDGNDVHLIEVDEIVKKGNSVTITSKENYTMDEFVDYVKIKKEENVKPSDIDMSEADEGVSLMDIEAGPRTVNTRASIVDKEVNSEIGFNMEYGNDNVKFSGGISGALEAKVEIIYDIHLFGEDYFKSEFMFKQEFKIIGAIKCEVEDDEDKAKLIKDLNLGKVRFPFGMTGLSTSAKIIFPIDWELGGSFESEIVSDSTVGFIYGTNEGYQPVNIKNIKENDIKATGTARLALGPKIVFSVEFLKDVVKGEVSAHGGGEIEAEIEKSLLPGADARHECEICLEGKVSKFKNAKLELSYKVSKLLSGKPVDITLLEVKDHKFDFYISLLNREESIHQGKVSFGKGECPNHTYKISFNPVDHLENTIESANTKVWLGNNPADGNEIFSGEGKFSRYMHKGEYLASSSDKSYKFSDKSFIVEDQAQEVIIPSHKKEDIPNGEDNLGGDESFEDTLELTFSSGVGAWATVMYLEKDGSFTGKYEDANIGYDDERGYYGMNDICEFTGKFTNIKKIDSKTYSMKLEDINYKYEIGKKWTENKTEYTATDAYGLRKGKDFTLYSPGKSLDGLDEEFLSWGYLKYSKNKLLSWGLHNKRTGHGFFSKDYIDGSGSSLVRQAGSLPD